MILIPNKTPGKYLLETMIALRLFFWIGKDMSEELEPFKLLGYHRALIQRNKARPLRRTKTAIVFRQKNYSDTS